MRFAVVLAGLLVGVGIAVAGLANRYELTHHGVGGFLWRLDRLTGEISVCLPKGLDGESLRKRLGNAGFSEEEINEHFRREGLDNGPDIGMEC